MLMDKNETGDRVGYSVSGLAAATGLPPDVILAEIKDGKIVTGVVDGEVSILRADALAWLDTLPAVTPEDVDRGDLDLTPPS